MRSPSSEILRPTLSIQGCFRERGSGCEMDLDYNNYGLSPGLRVRVTSIVRSRVSLSTGPFRYSCKHSKYVNIPPPQLNCHLLVVSTVALWYPHVLLSLLTMARLWIPCLLVFPSTQQRHPYHTTGLGLLSNPGTVWLGLVSLPKLETRFQDDVILQPKFPVKFRNAPSSVSANSNTEQGPNCSRNRR